MIKYAIFDFDGTLFDSNGIYVGLGKYYITSLGLVPTRNLDDDLKNLSLYEGAVYLKENYHLDKDVVTIQNDIQDLIRDQYLYAIKPKKKTKLLLETLRKQDVKMAIVSASHIDGILGSLKRCHLDHYFTCILTCEMLQTSKKSSKIYDEALKRLQGHKDETYVFEDAYHAIQTCVKNNYHVIGVEDAYEKNKEKIRELVDVYIDLDK